MKRIVTVCLLGCLMIGLLSGCIHPFLSEDAKIKEAFEKMYDVFDADSMHQLQEVTLSVSGRELDIDIEESFDVYYVALGSDDMIYHCQSTHASIVNEEEVGDSKKQIYYAGGVFYADTQVLNKKKQAMTPQEFLDHIDFDTEDRNEIADDIIKNGKVTMKNVAVTYAEDANKKVTLTVSENAELMIPSVLEAVGLSESLAEVEAYTCKRIYSLDKNMIVKNVEAKISCELIAFGETYAVEIAINDTIDAAIKKEDIPTLFGQKNYVEQDLEKMELFQSAYSELRSLATATIAETESFTMTSNVPENFSYLASTTTKQNVTSADVGITQTGKVTYNIRTAGQKNKRTSTDYTYEVKEGVATHKEGKKVVEKSEWKNPFFFYASGAIAATSFDIPEDKQVKSIDFSEKDGKLTCKYTLTAAALDDIIVDAMSVVLGSQTAQSLMYYIKDNDYSKNTGTLVLDTKTGAVIAHKVSIKLSPSIADVSYPIEFSYSMSVTDASLPEPPAADGEASV